MSINVNLNLPKVSVIVPVYNTARFLRRCISSIREQTYSNIEIICVDDGSTDSSPDILRAFSEGDGRIKLVRHEKNFGLFRARLTGVKASSGDYIAFVDSDDYINEDFIRCLARRAVSGGYDIVMGRCVPENTEGKRWTHAQYESMKIPDRFGGEVLSEYLSQEGYCFLWHAVWNKLYRAELFNAAMPFFEGIGEHIIMGEDILFSTVLHYYARSFSSVDFAYYFYLQHGAASTAGACKVSRFEKNLSDLALVFSHTERFLSERGVSGENIGHFREWRRLYSRFWCDNIRSSRLSALDKRRMLKRLCQAFSVERAEATERADNWFYSCAIPFDERYTELVAKVVKYDTVSFDLFDTVLVRPTLRPTDLFYFLNGRMRKYLDGNFHDIRTLAERIIREGACGSEITLDDIYSFIARERGLSPEVAEKMKNAEIECESKWLSVRESTKNLIELAEHLGHEVFITSDFYMGRQVLWKILKEKGIYCDELIVSCDFRLTKSQGGLFRILRERASSSKILHIGDSWESDYVRCREMGIEAQFYPAVAACLMNEISDINSTPSVNAYTRPAGQWISYEHSLNFFEVRCALAISARRIYDNPYISYLRGSGFNCSADFIGYFALGMHLWAGTKWLYERNIDRGGVLHFIARDGYLPKLAYDILNDGKSPRSDYIYASRKALLPLMLIRGGGAEELLPLVRAASKKRLDEWLTPVLSKKESTNECEYEKPLSDTELYKYIKYSLQNRLSDDKIKSYTDTLKAYFATRISAGDAVFDIGYSGRPVMALSELLSSGVSGFFIHRTSDAYMPYQRLSGINIESLYEYTPAITGSIREMLFSEQAPSCIGYSREGGAVRPLFEDYKCSYAERFAIDELQRQALDFVADMKELYSYSPELFCARPIDLSMPYEYLLSCKNRYDAAYFGAVRFEDEVYHGRANIGLVEIWQDSQDYHRVLTSHLPPRVPSGEGIFEKTVGELILPKSRLMRALFFLLFDGKTFVKKLKKQLFGLTD